MVIIHPVVRGGGYALNVPEAKGYIGERFDADAGQQYLNAPYYDPRIGMFLLPDCWEVHWPGVGTNRYPPLTDRAAYDS